MNDALFATPNVGINQSETIEGTAPRWPPPRDPSTIYNAEALKHIVQPRYCFGVRILGAAVD